MKIIFYNSRIIIINRFEFKMPINCEEFILIHKQLADPTDVVPSNKNC